MDQLFCGIIGFFIGAICTIIFMSIKEKKLLYKPSDFDKMCDKIAQEKSKPKKHKRFELKKAWENQVKVKSFNN